MVDVYLYQGHASPNDVTLRTVTPDVAAALSVYLYAGHASPNDVVLRYSGELGTVTVSGTFALTTDDVTLAAAGTVSAGGGSITGTLAFTTDAVTFAADAQNIPPPGSFAVANDYRRPAVLQPTPQRFVPGVKVRWWH